MFCISKHFSISWFFSRSAFCVACDSFKSNFDLFRLMMMPCLEHSSMRASIMANRPVIELDMMCRSSTNINPATLAWFACGAQTPQFSFCILLSVSLTYMIKSMGDRTEPCFRPWVWGSGVVVSPPIL